MNQHAATQIGRLCLSALVFIVGSACFSGLRAQTVYKCGNTYSQVPCPDARTVQIDDKREPEQKQQADAAIRRDTKLAKSLEKERLALEKLTPSATPPKRKASATAALKKETQEAKTLTKITPKRISIKTTHPNDFVAQVPVSEPKATNKK